MAPSMIPPAAADEPVQVGVNIANKLDVALAVGPTEVDYSTFEADLRENLRNRPIPVADEDLFITAAKAVSANTTNEFQWWTYDHTIPARNQQPTRLDRDDNGVAFKSATYPNYQAFYNYVIAQAKLGGAKTWNTSDAPSVAELAKYADLEPSTTNFKNIDDSTRQYIENSDVATSPAWALRTGTRNPSTGYVDSTDKTSPNFGAYSTAGTSNQTHPYDGNLFHMEESNNGSRMDFYGYGTHAYKDFRYLPNDQKTKKSFEFAIEEFAAYDALDGVGFFFNTDITDDPYGSGQKMSGYLLFLKYGSAAPTLGLGQDMFIYKFSDVDTKAFHNNGSNGVADYPGFEKIATASSGTYSGTDKYRRIKLDVYPTYAQIFYNGSASDSSVLTTPIAEGKSPVVSSGKTSANVSPDGTRVLLDSMASYGFGPMASYLNHSCSRPTAIAMQNISMTMDKVKTLVEVVDEPEWNENTKKFLVNLNEETIPDFEETNITARLLNRLRNDDIYFIGWATATNSAKSQDFLVKNDLKGTVVNMDSPTTSTYEEQIQAIADEIYKQYWIDNVGDIVLTTDNVVMSVTGADQTGTADDQYPDGKWKVVHRTSGTDPATPATRTGDDAFSNDEGIQSWSGITRSDLDVQFDKPGYYDLYYRDQYLKTITAHRPPLASFDVAIGEGGAVEFRNTSSDPDFATDRLTMPCTPGLTRLCSQWKYLDLDEDATPNNGVPTTLTEDHTYIVYLTVWDRYGEQTSISKQVRYVGEGSTPVYVAPFADFTLTPTKILPWGDDPQTVTLVNRSYDPQGLPITSTFTLVRDGVVVAWPDGSGPDEAGWEEGTIDVSDHDDWPVGEYAVSLVVANGKQDLFGADLVSAPYVLTFTIVDDNDPPTAAATPNGGTHIGNTTVTVRFTDVGDAGLATQRVAITDSPLTPDVDDPAWTAWSTSAARPVTVSQTGSYIHWEATDRVGNLGFGHFGPYTITKETTDIDLTVSPGSFVFGGGQVTLTATIDSTTPSTGSVHFYVDEVYIGSATINGSGVATLAYTPTMVGDVDFEAKYGGDSSHSSVDSDKVAYTITQSSAAVVVLDAQDKVYDGDQYAPTKLKVKLGGASAPTTAYDVSYEGEYTDGTIYGPTPTAPTEAGKYTVTVTTTDPRYVTASESADFTVKRATQAALSITGPNAQYEVDVNNKPTETLDTSGGTGDGTVSYAVTTQNPAGTATVSGDTVTMHTVGTFTVTATKAASRNYKKATATFDVEVVDTTAPTGTVTVTNAVTPVVPAGVSAWADFYSALLVFDHFSRGAATFTVDDVADNSGEAVTVSYLMSSEALSATEITGGGIVWTTYTGPVVRASTWKGIMYVRLVDSQGNAAYISSSGVVVYADTVQRTATFATSRYSTTAKKVPLTFNGNTVESVTVTSVPGGAPTPSMSGAYTVDYTGTTPGITFTGSFLAGLRSGTYTFTVAYDPLAEPFGASAWNMAPATTVVTVTVSRATPTVTLTAEAETNGALHTEDITLTAGVAGVTNGATPTGTVSFYAVTTTEACGAGTALSTQTWSGSPVTLALSRPAATTHTFCAVYSGDGDYATAGDTASVQINDWVTAVAVSSTPTKVVYKYGEQLDVTGGVLGLTWSDSTGTPSVDFVDLSAAAFTGYDPTVLGNQTVTVTYAGRTATFVVTVVDYQVDVVLGAPTTTAYEWGDPLSVAGGTIAQKMASGAVQGKVPLTTAMVSGFTSTQEGSQTLVVTNDWGEGSFSANYTVTVVDPVIEVRVTTPPDKTRYRLGDDLDLTGGELSIVKKSGTYTTPIDGSMVTGYDKDTLGNQSVTVTDSGHSTTFTVTVVDYQVGVVLVAPTKTGYEWGDPLSLVGGTIAQKMASGAVQGKVSLTAAMVSGFASTVEGKQTLVATNDWGEGSFSASFVVTVVDPVVEIHVKKPPNKTTYGPGEPLDLTGGEIYVVRKSGVQVVSMTDAMASGYISTQEGSQTITVNHSGKQTSFGVVIVPDGTSSNPGGGSTGSARSSRSGTSVGGSAAPWFRGPWIGPGGLVGPADGQQGSGDTADDELSDDTGVGDDVETTTAVPAQVAHNQGSGDGWALLNVVLAATGLVLTVCGALVMHRGRDTDCAGRRRRRVVGVAVSAAATLVGLVVVAFVLDLSRGMVFTDMWTPLLAVTFAGSLGGLLWSTSQAKAGTADLATAE